MARCSNYGAEEARLFLQRVVHGTPEVEIVVAHLGVLGPGYEAPGDEVMAVFGEANRVACDTAECRISSPFLMR